MWYSTLHSPNVIREKGMGVSMATGTKISAHPLRHWENFFFSLIRVAPAAYVSYWARD